MLRSQMVWYVSKNICHIICISTYIFRILRNLNQLFWSFALYLFYKNSHSLYKTFFSLQFSPRPPSGNSIALKATNFQFREINIRVSWQIEFPMNFAVHKVIYSFPSFFFGFCSGRLRAAGPHTWKKHAALWHFDLFLLILEGKWGICRDGDKKVGGAEVAMLWNASQAPMARKWSSHLDKEEE